MAVPLIEVNDYVLTKFNKPTNELKDIAKKDFIIASLRNQYHIMMDKSDKSYDMFKDNYVVTLQQFEHLIYPNTLTFSSHQSLLYLTTIDGIEQSIIIERKTQRVLFVKFMFDKPLYKQDTIFEGEILYDKKIKHMFLISDILILRGQKVRKNMCERLNTIHTLIEQHYRSIPRVESFDLLIKPFYKQTQLNELLQQITELRYSHLVNGVVFRPINDSKRGHYSIVKNIIMTYKHMSNPIVQTQFNIDLSDMPNIPNNNSSAPRTATYQQTRTTEKKIVTSNSFTYYTQHTSTRSTHSLTPDQTIELDTSMLQPSTLSSLTDISYKAPPPKQTQLTITHEPSNIEKKLSDMDNIVAVIEKEKDDVYNVYFKNPTNDKLYKYGYARIKTLRESQKINKIFEMIESQKCLMNCQCKNGEIIPSDFINSIDDLNGGHVDCDAIELL
jgi:hypothetical protein